MEYVILAILMMAFLTMAYQDLKKRQIHVVLPIVVFIGLYSYNRAYIEISQLLMSLSFVMITILAVTLYFSFKNKRILNPLQEHIGLGDILFFMAVIPMFNFRNYVLFYITGMIFSLVLFLMLPIKQREQSVPLAGLLSIYSLLLMLYTINTTPNLFFSFII